MYLNKIKKKNKASQVNLNLQDLKSLYDSNGFFIIKNVFKKPILEKLFFEIKAAKKTETYFDQNGLPRRIEKIYNKGTNLNKVNKILMSLLKEVFSKDFVIFKDKFNLKPPGGEGFEPHYDGVFQFRNKNNEIENGWYKYGDEFVNVLVALDISNKKNGTIEIANAHKNNFNFLLNKTKKNGTPELKDLRGLNFKAISLNKGDILIFKNTCPHRSNKNNSKRHRRILYYTYTPSVNGSKYNDYFVDKMESKNETSKSLSRKKI